MPSQDHERKILTRLMKKIAPALTTIVDLSFGHFSLTLLIANQANSDMHFGCISLYGTVLVYITTVLTGIFINLKI